MTVQSRVTSIGPPLICRDPNMPMASGSVTPKTHTGWTTLPWPLKSSKLIATSKGKMQRSGFLIRSLSRLNRIPTQSQLHCLHAWSLLTVSRHHTAHTCRRTKTPTRNHRARVAELRSESRKRQRTPTVVNHTTNYQQVNHNTNVFTTMGSWVSKMLGKVSSGAAVPALPAPAQEQQQQQQQQQLQSPPSEALVTRTTETRNATTNQDRRGV